MTALLSCPDSSLSTYNRRKLPFVRCAIERQLAKRQIYFLQNLKRDFFKAGSPDTGSHRKKWDGWRASHFPPAACKYERSCDSKQQKMEGERMAGFVASDWLYKRQVR